MSLSTAISDVKSADACTPTSASPEVSEDVFVDRGSISCSSPKRTTSSSVVKFSYMYYKIMII